jgi:hypothetical protein
VADNVSRGICSLCGHGLTCSYCRTHFSAYVVDDKEVNDVCKKCYRKNEEAKRVRKDL